MSQVVLLWLPLYNNIHHSWSLSYTHYYHINDFLLRLLQFLLLVSWRWAKCNASGNHGIKITWSCFHLCYAQWKLCTSYSFSRFLRVGWLGGTILCPCSNAWTISRYELHNESHFRQHATTPPPSAQYPILLSAGTLGMHQAPWNSRELESSGKIHEISFTFFIIKNSHRR